jgi:hypothetical protein
MDGARARRWCGLGKLGREAWGEASRPFISATAIDKVRHLSNGSHQVLCRS